MCTRQRGLTLIELIVFIVIVGVALAGVLTVLTHTARHSADPMVRKQALAIAEAILEEVMLQPFTWCDPDDPAAPTATGYGGCATAENNLAAEGGEARGSFDNVNDYNGLATTTNISGGGAAPYNATVTVAQNSLNGIPADASLLITVSVTAGGETIQLQGYRTRHSPNALP
jgi:MSHA pilin protein MshD